MAGTLVALLLAGSWAALRGPEASAPVSPEVKGIDMGWARTEPTTFTFDIEGLTTLGDAHSREAATAERGVILVNMWGSWCAPCRKEMPVLQQVARTTKDFDVVGVSRDWREAPALDAMQQYKVTYSNYRDSDDRLADAIRNVVPYAVLPVSFLVVDGDIVWVHVGVFDSAQDVMSDVKRLVKAT